MNPAVQASAPAVASAPFDAVAGEYDATFTNRRLGRWLRHMVWKQLDNVFKPGERVLELGCGTGADAVRMAHRGVHVLATDRSSGMLQVAQRKAIAASVDDRLVFAQLDLASLEWIDVEKEVASHGRLDAGAGPAGRLSGLLVDGEQFAGAYSNFGVLNCVADRRPIAALLAQLVRPSGHVVVVLMGPFCPWEMLWHLLHGEVGRAVRRLRGGQLAHVGQGRYVRVWYPSLRQLQAEFASNFRLLEIEGVGALLPSTQLSQLVDRWPRLFEALVPLEERLRRKLPWRWLNDHYLATFQRI